MNDREARLEALEDIKLRALFIQGRLMSADPQTTMAAEKELASLLDLFCEEFRDFITPPMARALKKDFETFIVLIDWTVDHCRKTGAVGTGFS